MSGLSDALHRCVVIPIPAMLDKPALRPSPALKLAYCERGRGGGLVTMRCHA
jgi:hypothetical protein